MTGCGGLKILRTQPTRIILFRGHRCISVVDLHLEQVNPEIWNLLDQRPPFQCLREPTGARVLATSRLEKPTSPEQELDAGGPKIRRLRARSHSVF